MLLALVVWAITCSLHAAYYVASTLALPEIADAYVRAVQFQLLMFAILRLGLWLIGLGALIVALRSPNSRLQRPAGSAP
jgi:Na+/proline symporter